MNLENTAAGSCLGAPAQTFRLAKSEFASVGPRGFEQNGAPKINIIFLPVADLWALSASQTPARATRQLATVSDDGLCERASVQFS